MWDILFADALRAVKFPHFRSLGAHTSSQHGLQDQCIAENTHPPEEAPADFGTATRHHWVSGGLGSPLEKKKGVPPSTKWVARLGNASWQMKKHIVSGVGRNCITSRQGPKTPFPLKTENAFGDKQFCVTCEVGVVGWSRGKDFVRLRSESPLEMQTLGKARSPE